MTSRAHLALSILVPALIGLNHDVRTAGAELMTSPAWTFSHNESGGIGWSVGTAGDVNGDGYSDVIVGAAFSEGRGRAYAFHGSAAGLASDPAWSLAGSQAPGQFGYSVGTAGDVNGDGFSDVIVGSYDYTNGQLREGRAYVYHGSATGLSFFPAWIAESDQEHAHFGTSVGTAGDVNGDGFSDVIVGASNYDNGQSNEGRAYAYYGSAAGLATSPSWIAENNVVNSFLGHAVGTAGDVNGDGFSDVIVGAPIYSHFDTDEGGAYVYHGTAAGLDSSPSWAAESNQNDAHFGRSVGTAGDVNGDGFADVIVGVPFYDNGHTNKGGAFVYHGGAAGVSSTAAWIAEGDLCCTSFGGSVGTAGDVNGDGFSDVVVGAYRYYNGQGHEGRAFAYHGSASVLTAAPRWMAEGDQTSAFFGYSVGTAGDVNGDGYSDVIVGAYGYDNGEANGAGRALVYHGAVDEPIGVGEPSASPAGLRLEASAPNPFANTTQIAYTLPGRGPLRLAVYDVAGREVTVLADRVQEPGRHTATWGGLDARGVPVPAGVYFTRLEFEGRVDALKIVLAP